MNAIAAQLWPAREPRWDYYGNPVDEPAPSLPQGMLKAHEVELLERMARFRHGQASLVDIFHGLTPKWAVAALIRLETAGRVEVVTIGESIEETVYRAVTVKVQMAGWNRRRA